MVWSPLCLLYQKPHSKCELWSLAREFLVTVGVGESSASPPFFPSQKLIATHLCLNLRREGFQWQGGWGHSRSGRVDRSTTEPKGPSMSTPWDCTANSYLVNGFSPPMRMSSPELQGQDVAVPWGTLIMGHIPNSGPGRGRGAAPWHRATNTTHRTCREQVCCSKQCPSQPLLREAFLNQSRLFLHPRNHL